MEIHVRPYKSPADCAGLANLYSAASDQVWSAADLTERERSFPAEGCLIERVAVDAADRMVAYARAETRHVARSEGALRAHVVVAPEFRRRGLAKRVLGEVEAAARGAGFARLGVQCRSEERDRLAFAQAVGFVVKRQEYEMRLDMTSRLPPIGEALSGLGSLGLVAQVYTKADDALLPSLYDLMDVTASHVPGQPTAPYYTYDQWHELYKPFFQQDESHTLFLILADGEVVGVSFLAPGFEGDLYTTHTSVHPDFRRRKIGLALKEMTIDHARRVGATALRAHNDVDNQAMLAVNRRLGYEVYRTRYFLWKELT